MHTRHDPKKNNDKKIIHTQNHKNGHKHEHQTLSGAPEREDSTHPSAIIDQHLEPLRRQI